MSTPTIQWYPGHIAKAERKLHEVLSAVDVVVEVRDARIPTSTTHPSVEEWLRNRNIQRVVCDRYIILRACKDLK